MPCRLHKPVGGLSPNLESVFIALLKRLPRTGICSLRRLHWLKNHRSGRKQKEHEHHCSDKQDEQLHGDLYHSVEQKTQSALANGFAGQISLHLALITSKIGQSKESAANEPAPDVVAVAEIPMHIHYFQASRRTGQMQRVQNRYIGRHGMKNNKKADSQCEENHRHLLHVS